MLTINRRLINCRLSKVMRVRAAQPRSEHAGVMFGELSYVVSHRMHFVELNNSSAKGFSLLVFIQRAAQTAMQY